LLFGTFSFPRHQARRLAAVSTKLSMMSGVPPELAEPSQVEMPDGRTEHGLISSWAIISASVL
jgi:hypothetical protein